jgi:hypothetical protein
VAILDGVQANAANFNNAFVSKSQDSTVTANIDLNDADISQGTQVTQTQRELNSLNSFTGKTINTAKDVKPSWSTNNFGASTDSLFDRVNNIDGEKASANGLATLDANSKLNYSQEPGSIADDSATGANATLSAVATTVVRLTNASLTSIDMIPAGTSAQRFVLINRTGVAIDINNETGATSTDRILTGTGANLELENNAALWFSYDSTTSRWQVTGGSGSGALQTGYQEIPAGTVNGVNTSFGPLTYVPTTEASIIVFVDGLTLKDSEWSLSGSNIVLSTAPIAGQEIYVWYMTEGGVALPSVSGIFKVEYRTITSGEDSAKQLTLAQTPAAPTEVMLDMIGGTAAFYSNDFTVTGTTLTWNGLGLDGILSTSDKIRITYVY